MIWKQVIDPLHNIWLSALVAVLPVIGLAGMIPTNPPATLRKYFDILLAIGNQSGDLQTAIADTGINLERTATARQFIIIGQRKCLKRTSIALVTGYDQALAHPPINGTLFTRIIIFYSALFIATTDKFIRPILFQAV